MSREIDRERAARLMMAALDGETSHEERRELEGLLAEDAALRKEWETMSRIKQVTSEVSLSEPPPETWDEYWGSVYNRVERGIAWIFLSIGAIVLLSWGAWEAVLELLREAGVPWFVKGAYLLLTTGFVVLVVSVVRERIFMRGRDPYKEVKR